MSLYTNSMIGNQYFSPEGLLRTHVPVNLDTEEYELVLPKLYDSAIQAEMIPRRMRFAEFRRIFYGIVSQAGQSKPSALAVTQISRGTFVDIHA